MTGTGHTGTPGDAVPALLTEALTKAYRDVQALRGVDLCVRRGELLSLIGPNGAGKTTLLSLAAGLLRPGVGSIFVLGVDPGRRSVALRRLVGFAQQDVGVYPTLTAAENLLLFADLAGLRGAERDERIEETAHAFELTGLLGRRVRTLSGGERRLLHVAIAVVHRPPLLLLDEPTAGLDPAGRSALLAFVRETARSGTAVVYSTNRLDEAEELGGSVAILDRGTIVAEGPLDGLLAAHGERTVEVAYQGLRAVFLAVTGRRYEAAGHVVSDGGDVPTA